jgi:hypothetical protein
MVDRQIMNGYERLPNERDKRQESTCDIFCRLVVVEQQQKEEQKGKGRASN